MGDGNDVVEVIWWG